MGEEHIAAPASIAFVFTFTTVGLLVSSLVFFRGLLAGLLGGIILLASVNFTRVGASQIADIPLSYYILATIVLVTFHFAGQGKSKGWMILAGLSAGLAAWTKNEGILFCIVCLFSLTVVALYSDRGFKELRNDIPPFLVGMTVVMIGLFAFKLLYAPQNDLVSGQSINNTLRNATDLTRHLTISRSILGLLGDVGDAPVLIIPVIILFLGVNRNQIVRKELRFSILVLFLMCAGYYLVYLFTPRPLSWHLETSLHRLLIHLWPATIFVTMMVVAIRKMYLPIRFPRTESS
jgi:hypothetical protein